MGKNYLSEGKEFLRKYLYFDINSNFLIPISLKPDGVNLWYLCGEKLGFFGRNRIQSLKY